MTIPAIIVTTSVRENFAFFLKNLRALCKGRAESMKDISRIRVDANSGEISGILF
jgi:hypothetical protein